MLMKMVATTWRKPGMSLEEFTARWSNEHARLVTQHKDAMGFARYVQSHTFASPQIAEFARARGWASPPDGIAELWWESEEALLAAFGSQAAAEASGILEADERVFVDTTRTAAFLTTEYEVFNILRK